jgi:short-subunit dehydrogenase
VVVLARDKGKLEILQAELHSDYLEIIPCDIKDKKQLSEIIPRLEADIFINNAGIGYRKNTYEESLEEIEDTIVTNLTAAMRCSRLITPAMIAQKS